MALKRNQIIALLAIVAGIVVISLFSIPAIMTQTTQQKLASLGQDVPTDLDAFFKKEWYSKYESNIVNYNDGAYYFYGAHGSEMFLEPQTKLEVSFPPSSTEILSNGPFYELGLRNGTVLIFKTGSYQMFGTKDDKFATNGVAMFAITVKGQTLQYIGVCDASKFNVAGVSDFLKVIYV